MKTCKICSLIKDDSEFRKDRRQCQKCLSEKSKDIKKNYYEKNKEHLLSEMKKNYLLNIDDRKQRNKNYREKNKESLKNYMKLYRIENSEKVKKYKIDNKEKIKEYNIQYWSKRLKSDELFRFKSVIRKRISYLIRNKKLSTEEIIGCSFEEFKLYIESKFENWMNWENYGLYNGEYEFGWDIDHIIPLSSAETQDDVYKLCHFTNLQPLCSKINRYEKKDKYEKNQ